MNHTTDSMTQTIQGFYQASNESPKAKLTHIVSSGQPNFTERLLFEGKVYATNPFVSAAGPSWDNPTFDVSDKMSGAPSVTTKVDHVGSTNFDCLSWGAVILSTTVQDSDNDGLLDLWETSKFTDVATGKEVDLPGMGANKDQKDLFVQVDYMTNGHSHLPLKAALDRVAAAYKSAPIDSGKGIQVHFGVGGNYQTSPPDPAIIPASFHVGGNPIDENTTCPKGPCAFRQPEPSAGRRVTGLSATSTFLTPSWTFFTTRFSRTRSASRQRRVPVYRRVFRGSPTCLDRM